MAKTKHHRDKKKQLGQFLTPGAVVSRILSQHTLKPTDRVLEPGFGEGAFLLPLIEAFLELRGGNLAAVLTENVWGVEIDATSHEKVLASIRDRWGDLPAHHNLVRGDFLLHDFPKGREVVGTESLLFAEDGFFDLIIGNPPFGGTICVEHQDRLEARFGFRGGAKIKKETYSFFIVKALDLVRIGGTIEFICSDTFLTIPTMRGLRRSLMNEGRCEVVRLDEFSPETSYPMVVLRFVRGAPSSTIRVEHREISRADIERTENLSWQAGGQFAHFFGGPVLGEYVVASSGMTTGKNEYFVRRITGNAIEEPFEFVFVDERITLARELERARLGQLSERLKQSIRAREQAGEVRRNVLVQPRETPLRVELPHADYRYYNKAQPGLVYAPPAYAIFWKDDGDAVLTYKKNGNWYLGGVGGAPFFGREGLTWRLIASNLDVRYLPSGYILDSGAPCAFLRDGVARDELFFILGWLLTGTATAILKGVLNHTMNIQSKDVERLPYPSWVPAERKAVAIHATKRLVERAMAGERFGRLDPEIIALELEYHWAGDASVESHPERLSAAPSLLGG